ncbi:MAG: TerB family tellurite resistance protein [Pseudomonadota bacterium]
MSIASLAGVLKIFGGTDPTPEEQAQLAKEVMLMTLARATAADTNIKAIEVEKVREVLKAHTGDDFPDSEIRVAANSRIYESAPLDKYVATSARKLNTADRLDIARALEEVINADGRVSDREITFFNDIVNSLDLTPAQLMGMNAE